MKNAFPSSFSHHPSLGIERRALWASWAVNAPARFGCPAEAMVAIVL
jgi:hypothetical protein